MNETELVTHIQTGYVSLLLFLVASHHLMASYGLSLMSRLLGWSAR